MQPLPTITRSILSLFCVAILFVSSCNSANPNPRTVEQMVSELCVALEKLDPEEPLSIMEVAGDMMELQQQEEYKDVTEEHIVEQMAKTCPEGAANYDEVRKKLEEME